jgi:hypothetical protein
MSVAELALLITTLSGALVALLNTRTNTQAIGKLQEGLKEERHKQETWRNDVLQIGEQLHHARLDNAVLAETVNQLFIEFRDVTGHRPQVNLDRLKHMQTIQYITGPLGPLDLLDK